MCQKWGQVQGDAIGRHPEIFDQSFIEEIVQAARSYGVASKFLQEHIAPHQVSVGGSNYRETLLARGLNPRQRAVLDLLSDEAGAADIWNYRIYAPEALTPFALLLRGRFPRFLGSEYAETSEQRNRPEAWFAPPELIAGALRIES